MPAPTTQFLNLITPHDATAIHQFIQNEQYAVSDIKLVLRNTYSDSEKVIMAKASVLASRNEYFAGLLSGKFSDVVPDEHNQCATVHIDEECEVYIMELLLQCLYARPGGDPFEMSVVTQNASKMTFAEMHRLIQFASLADKWQIHCFDFVPMKTWLKEILADFNEWYIKYWTQQPNYVQISKPELVSFRKNDWVCKSRQHVQTKAKEYEYTCNTWNRKSRLKCGKCGTQRPDLVSSKEVADMTPTVPIDEHIFALWHHVLGDSDDLFFYALLHAAKGNRVSQQCFELLQQSRHHLYRSALLHEVIADRIFRVTRFDIMDSESYQRTVVDKYTQTDETFTMDQQPEDRAQEVQKIEQICIEERPKSVSQVMNALKDALKVKKSEPRMTKESCARVLTC